MPGQDGHFGGAGGGRRGTAAVTAVSVLVAGTLLSAVGVAALRDDTASAPTVLQEAAGASLVLADGTRRAAVAGERVPSGATVELPGPGVAVLVTRDRETYLAQASSVEVVDGARQRLRTGTAYVDAGDAPGVELTTAAGVVTVREDAVVRVDGGSVPRVGVLAADDEVGAEVRASGRRTATAVGAYRQVQVPRGGLPGRVDPLRLAEDDAYEARLATALVDADRFLNATGDTLQGASAQAAVVRTALSTDVPGVPADREGALGYLVAAAAGDPAAELPEVRELREAGGSWGVVAALMDVSVDDVGARLDALLAPTAEALAAGADADAGLAGVVDVLGLGGTAGDVPVEGGPAPAPQPTAGPTGPSDPGDPTSPPSPTPGPGGLVGTVEDVVDTVLDLVDPSPSAVPALPLPVRSPAPVASTSPAPLVSVQLPPLLR